MVDESKNVSKRFHEATVFGKNAIFNVFQRNGTFMLTFLLPPLQFYENRCGGARTGRTPLRRVGNLIRFRYQTLKEPTKSCLLPKRK